jgi:hypothetical protein
MSEMRTRYLFDRNALRDRFAYADSVPPRIENRKDLLLAAPGPIAGSYDGKHCVAFSALVQSEFQIEMNIFLLEDLNQIIVATVQPYQAVHLQVPAQVDHANGLFAKIIDNTGVGLVGERQLLI